MPDENQNCDQDTLWHKAGQTSRVQFEAPYNLGEESGWWQHGGAAGCEQLQSSVFPPRRGRVETTTTRGVSGKRATKMDTDVVWKMLRHGTKY